MRTVLVLLLLALPGLTAQTANRVIALDGANDYAFAVIIGGFNPNEISVEAWIRPEAPMPGSALRETRVVSKGTEGLTGPLLDGRFSLTYTEDGTGGPMAGIATFRVYLGSFIPNDQAVVSSPMPVPTDQWTHLAGTFSNVSGQVTLYVNGSVVAAAGTSMMGAPLVGATMTSSPQPLNIGGIGFASTIPITAFHGQIDEVRAWSVERTATQIGADFLNQLSSGTGLVNAWHFDGDALSIFNPPPPGVAPVGGSPRYPISFVPGFAGGAFPAQQECQLNQPEASLSGPGVLVGDTSGPAVVDALSGTITANSTLIGNPWDLVLTAPEFPVGQANGGFVLPGGQIVNVDLAAPSLAFLTNFLAPFNGTLAFPFNLPSGLPPITAQMVVGDPASPVGVRVSAPLVLAPGF